MTLISRISALLIALALAAAALVASVVPSEASSRALPADAAPPAAAEPSGAPAAHRTMLAQARAATARFHDVEAALAAGYEPVSPCTEVPALGAMGVHYLNPHLVDDVVDVRQPELLLYLPTRAGMRLIGVEYFVPSQDQDDSDGLDAHDRPFLGDVPFDGPMAGHGPGEPFHYDLHVWVWAHNPAGVFAQWNPSLSCPGAAPAGPAHQH